MHAQCQAWNHHHDPARSYQEDSCHNWSYKCHPNLTPAHQLALGSDLDGAPMDEEWNYSSVVGMMLLYLSTNTSCPDIAFTTASQVVHFSQRKPQQVNSAAIKTIIWYLHSTTSKFGITSWIWPANFRLIATVLPALLVFTKANLTGVGSLKVVSLF